MPRICERPSGSDGSGTVGVPGPDGLAGVVDADAAAFFAFGAFLAAVAPEPGDGAFEVADAVGELLAVPVGATVAHA